MEVIMENVRQYILTLKESGKFSTKDIANVSDMPIETVRNILSGKTSKNAGFATISKIIISLGGDLNDAVGYEKKKEAEVNSIVSLKETYEMRIADITKSYELRLEDMKKVGDLRVADVLKCCDIWGSSIRRLYEEQLQSSGK